MTIRHPGFLASLLALCLCTHGATPTTPTEFQAASPTATTISLAGVWRFTMSPAQAPATWAAGDIDESTWRTLNVGNTWKGQGVAEHGIGWYRQRVPIPAAWAGRLVSLRLGTAGGAIEVFLNGASIGTRARGQQIVLTLAPAAVRFGAVNTIAIRVHDEDKDAGGLLGAPFIAGIGSDLDAPTLSTTPDGHQRFELKGLWRFQPSAATDPPGWERPAFNDAAWTILPDDANWADAEFRDLGVGLYRRAVHIPAAWAGEPLFIKLGKLKPGDTVWLNGREVGGLHGKYAFLNREDRSYYLPPEVVKFGAMNLIAIRLSIAGAETGTADTGRLSFGGFVIERDPGHVRMRWSGEPGEVPAESFDVSRCQRGAALEIIRPLPKEVTPDAAITAVVNDRFGNRLTTGPVTIAQTSNGQTRAVIAFDAVQSRALYQRGGFDLKLAIPAAAGRKALAVDSTVPYLSYTGRDSRALPPLAETWEQTSYGRLRLVDSIDCAKAPEEDEHPYLESGLSKPAQFQSPGVPAKITVREILGSRCREVSEGFFAYRLGRGRIAAHREYLVRLDYPEDVPRYASVEIMTGWNQLDIGWRNGLGKDDPYDDFPLSGSMQSFDSIVVTDDRTYGSGGAESTPIDHGLWVFILDKGRKATPQYAGGPAVSRIRLYEIDTDKNSPIVTRPTGQPQRTLMVDWERGPQLAPADMVRYCRLMGYDAVAPCIQKWAFAAYWRAGNEYIHQQPSERAIYQQYLDACRTSGVKLIPRIEYGGTKLLPDAAKALGPDGKYAKPSRFAEWGADIVHPDTWTDLEGVVDTLVKAHADNPQLAGLLWRQRCDRIQPGYSRQDIEQFAKDRKLPLPAGDDRALAAWAATGTAAAEYADWWQHQLHDFHLRLRDKLRAIRPDLRLWWYHWDSDKFSVGPFDWFSAQNYAAIGRQGGLAVRATQLKQRAALTGADYARMARTGVVGYSLVPSTHLAMRADLYRQDTGISLFAPANYRYLSDSPEWLDWFRTGDGVAMSNQITYDEHGGRSLNPKYETSMIVPAGPAFSMANEVRACFHADPTTITYTAYTFGRGFADAHRRFAQAYLALPAVPGAIIPTTDPDVRIRTYPANPAGLPAPTYVAVIHRGMTPRDIKVTIPGPWPPTTTVTDQVTRLPVPTNITPTALTFTIKAGPMELDAYLIQPTITLGR